MNNIAMLIQSLALGIVLGVVYFGGLWLTMRHLPGSHNPALLTLASFLGRSAVCLLGFYLVLGSGLEGLIACLSGFILTKLALILRLGMGVGLNGRADP
jgi:F1F0 ATPase subunit 2